MAEPTFIVVGGYVGRDGQHRVYVNGRMLPLLTDEPMDEGSAVRIVGDRAVKA